jgi:hypothetical protein
MGREIDEARDSEPDAEARRSRVTTSSRRSWYRIRIVTLDEAIIDGFAAMRAAASMRPLATFAQ